jgi:hypothetical protein
MYLILIFLPLKLIILTNEQFFILFVAVFAEITTLVAIVTKYLFSKDNSLDISELVKGGEKSR